MTLFTVDSTMCKRDGICASECPAGIISMAGEDNYPTPVKGAEYYCINCGHCVAVCPQGALALKTMSPQNSTHVQKDMLPGPDQTIHLLASRRSIRSYKKQSVERDILAKLIDIGRYAPSGSNKQPVNWLVIEDSDKVNRLAELVVDWMRFMLKEKPELARAANMDAIVASCEKGQDRICRGAPHMIVAHAPKIIPTAQADCAIGLNYVELAAYSMGLGACWAGYVQAAASVYPPVIDVLGLPEGHQCFGALLVGHPMYSYHRIPVRNEPVVSWR